MPVNSILSLYNDTIMSDHSEFLVFTDVNTV